MRPLKVMTFNIRTSLADDGPNHWDLRKEFLFQTVRRHDPDIVGFQEPTPSQWRELEQALAPGWVGVSHSRQDASSEERNHWQGFFYKPMRLELRRHGCFWLSDTPDVPGSVSFTHDWGARTCVWGVMKDKKTGREFVFGDTHLDTNPASWLPGAKVLHQQMDKIAGENPTVLVGDFNCSAGSEPWRYMKETAEYHDAWNAVGNEDLGVNSFHAFTGINGLPLDQPEVMEKWLSTLADPLPVFRHYRQHVLDHRNYRIDWILYKGALRAVEVCMDTEKKDGRSASDHFAVMATFEWT